MLIFYPNNGNLSCN